MKKKAKVKRVIVLFFFSLFLLLSFSEARVLPVYAVVNCKIFPVSGPPIEKGVIVIRNGLIESIGEEGKIVIPEDAEIIEGEGCFAYPGLIDAHGSFFLETKKEEEPSSERERLPALSPQEKFKPHPEFQVFKSLKPKKSVLESLHRIGFTTVLVVPEEEIFAGQSVLLNLNGEEAQAMVVKNPFALHINFVTNRNTYPTSLMGTMAFLRQSFLDTEHYALHSAFFSRHSKGLRRPEYDPFLESLIPFVAEKKPVVFNCANLEDIKRALILIDEFKLNGYIAGANEAWRVVGHLERAKVPLFISLDYKPPLNSIYATQGEELREKAEKEIYPENPAILSKKGLRFALCSHTLKKSEDILKNVQKAIERGLPREEALKAMTIIPARFLGVDNLLGSLEQGKIANIIFTSGEIFKEGTRVKRVFVDGLSFEVKEPPKAEAPALFNISGRWLAKITSPMGDMEMTLEIEQEGNSILGKILSEFGQWEITDGLITGKELSFTISAMIMGETVELTFKGEAEMDSLVGTFSFMGITAAMRATRIPGENFKRGGIR